MTRGSWASIYSSDYALFNQTPPTVTAPTGAKTLLSYSAAPAEVCTVDSVTGALTFTGLRELSDHGHRGGHGEL